MKLIIFIAALAAAPCHLAALSPTRSQHAWVAGTGETGAEDGPFMVASFDRPGGILFYRGQNRLIVADTGNQALRAVDLGHRNSVTTLRITQSGTGAAFPWLEPVALAWKVDGRLLYCFDRKKPGVALVDLASGSAQWLPLPLSVTSRSGTSFQLAEATALHAVPGDFGVLALRGPGLLFFDLPGGRTAVSGLWGLPGGIADLGSDTDGLWAISREANLLFRLAPDSAQPGWMDAFPKIVTGTANCPDMVADTAVGRAVANPWAIVKGVSPLKVACNAPAIMAYRNASGFESWTMLDQHGLKIGLQNDDIYDDDMKLLKTRTEYNQMVGPKRLFAKPGYVCEDPDDDRWYLSDTKSNRIISFTRSRPDDPEMNLTRPDGIQDMMMPLTKPAGVRRIAIVSACYFLSAKTTMRKMDSFSKRLQWYLNVLSSLHDGDAYETMFYGTSIPPDSSLMVYVKSRYPSAIRDYHADEVYIAMRPRDLATIVRGYQLNPMDKDGLPQAQWDPEYATSPRTWAELSACPEYLDLLKYVMANRDQVSALQVQKKFMLNVLDDEQQWPPLLTHDNVNQEYLKKVFALYAHEFGTLKREMDGMAAAQSRTVQVTIGLYPEHATLGPQEVNDPDAALGSLKLIRQDFKEMCQKLGIRFFDFVDQVRVYGVDSPMVEVEDGHLTQNGADLLGLLTAERFLDPKAAAAPPTP